MTTATDRQDACKFWGLRTLSVLLSAGAAFSYLHSMGYGIAAGDLIGLRGREGDVAFAQRWATVWLTTAVCCLGVSVLAGALTTSIYEDAARLSRLIGRLMMALVVSFVLALLIFSVSFWIMTYHIIPYLAELAGETVLRGKPAGLQGVQLPPRKLVRSTPPPGGEYKERMVAQAEAI